MPCMMTSSWTVLPPVAVRAPTQQWTGRHAVERKEKKEKVKKIRQSVVVGVHTPKKKFFFFWKRKKIEGKCVVWSVSPKKKLRLRNRSYLLSTLVTVASKQSMVLPLEAKCRSTSNEAERSYTHTHSYHCWFAGTLREPHGTGPKWGVVSHGFTPATNTGTGKIYVEEVSWLCRAIWARI